MVRKLVQKLSKDNDGVTFVLRGEIRNRTWFSGGLGSVSLTVGLNDLKVFSDLNDSMILLTPVNIHPSNRQTRIASCQWNNFLHSLK